ncbi:MAG: TolC family protein [Planctomycetia bacterium]|nr:TolC family protein [Planctomycetia bacterium]
MGVSIDLVPVALENGQIRLTASANVSRVTGDEKAIESQDLHGKGDLYTGESLLVYEEAISALLVVTPRRMSSDPAGHRSPPQIVEPQPKPRVVRAPAKPKLDDEIRELRDDVKVLRRDVSRLIEILEDRDSTSLKTVPSGDDHSSNNSTDASLKEMWDVTLDEVIAIGMQNSKAIRDLGGATSFGIDGKKEVVLSRVNKEVNLAEFEAAVRNHVSDTEEAYWQLWAAQGNLDTAKKSRDATQKLWNEIFERVRGGMVPPQAEVQARDQYFFFREQLEAALKELYSRERKLRSLIGVATSDGRLMRAADQPTTDKYIIDWDDAKKTALANSVELCQQRSVVKQAELELAAAKNSLQPQLDRSRATEWYKRGVGGIDFLSPDGSRRASVGVRNAELNVTREKARLEDMELNAMHLLAKAARDVDFFYQSAKTTFNRSLAAEAEVESTTLLYRSGKSTLDLVLDAQRRLAQTKNDHTSARAHYSTAIKDVRYRTGSLLVAHNLLIEVAEEPVPAAQGTDESFAPPPAAIPDPIAEL